MKITMPFGSLPSPAGAAGTGDLEVFDLVTIKKSWGGGASARRWGF